MYPAIIVFIISISSWNWIRLHRRIQVLLSEQLKTKSDLFAQAESEVKRLGEMAEEMKRLQAANVHLEASLKERRTRLVEKERALELALVENEHLCMKLARAVWQNGGSEAMNALNLRERESHLGESAISNLPIDRNLS